MFDIQIILYLHMNIMVILSEIIKINDFHNYLIIILHLPFKINVIIIIIYLIILLHIYVPLFYWFDEILFD